MAVPAADRDALLRELKDSGVETTAVIGEVLEPDSLGGKRIRVTD